MKAELPKQRQEHLFDQVVFPSCLKVGEKQLPSFQFSSRKWSVRIRRGDGYSVRRYMAQITLLIFRVECLITFSSERKVEVSQSCRAIGTFVCSVRWVHRYTDHGAECRQRYV